jgi:hypothetical protein
MRTALPLIALFAIALAYPQTDSQSKQPCICATEKACVEASEDLAEKRLAGTLSEKEKAKVCIPGLYRLQFNLSISSS